MDWRPARRPLPEPLSAAGVVLEPLDPAAHAADLYDASHGDGADPELWRYLPYGPFAGPGEYEAFLAGWAAAGDPLAYAILDPATGRAAGVATYLHVVPEHGRIEIGHIWFGRGIQRSRSGTAAIYALARHAFDELGNRRLEWACNARNARSRAAAERFGFTFEGVFRQHQVVKGENRDTAWFSLLDGEWPAARAAFEAWLAPGNFGPDGRRRRPLADLRQRP
jgi:RimJ/RimL family protein N-acetyltransferase